MRKRLLLLLLLPVSVTGADTGTGAVPAPKDQYSLSARRDYITKAMKIVSGTAVRELENLQKFIDTVDSTQCQSDFEGLALECLREKTRSNCGGGPATNRSSRCDIMSDLAVVNKLNEKRFVSRDERLEALKRSASDKGFTAIYSKLLKRKYGMLSTEFVFFSAGACEPEKKEKGRELPCLAKQLDEYCMSHADLKNVPWQACVSAVVWFLGTAR